ncbi:MAG: uracil-DNA glycosylase, partial [Candidatus Tantalella remota]|nr:uracil-DNA glycosylase [Candidatus Tantalella remota]
AAQTLLNSEISISKLRGKFYDYHGAKLMPTYHPAYLLRNSAGKKDVWEDMQAIAKELGVKIPEKSE